LLPGAIARPPVGEGRGRRSYARAWVQIGQLGIALLRTVPASGGGRTRPLETPVGYPRAGESVAVERSARLSEHGCDRSTLGRVGQHVDAALFAVLRDVSRVPAVLAAQQKLQSLGVRTLGAVVIGEGVDAYGRGYRIPMPAAK